MSNPTGILVENEDGGYSGAIVRYGRDEDFQYTLNALAAEFGTIEDIRRFLQGSYFETQDDLIEAIPTKYMTNEDTITLEPIEIGHHEIVVSDGTDLQFYSAWIIRKADLDPEVRLDILSLEKGSSEHREALADVLEGTNSILDWEGLNFKAQFYPSVTSEQFAQF